MRVPYTLVLHCIVHVYFVLQLHTLHTCSRTHWDVIVKTGLRIKCLDGEFLAKVLIIGVPRADMRWVKLSGLGSCLISEVWIREVRVYYIHCISSSQCSQYFMFFIFEFVVFLLCLIVGTL